MHKIVVVVHTITFKMVDIFHNSKEIATGQQVKSKKRYTKRNQL